MLQYRNTRVYRNRDLERTHCQSQPSPCSALINTSILSSYHSKLPKLHKCPKPVKMVTWLAPLRYFRPHRLSKEMYSAPLHPRQSPVRQLWKESLYSLLVEGFTAVFLKVFFFNNLTHDGSIYGAYLPLFTHIDHLKETYHLHVEKIYLSPMDPECDPSPRHRYCCDPSKRPPCNSYKHSLGFWSKHLEDQDRGWRWTGWENVMMSATPEKKYMKCNKWGSMRKKYYIHVDLYIYI